MTTSPSYHNANLAASPIEVSISPGLQTAYDIWKRYGDRNSAGRAAAERVYNDLLNNTTPVEGDIKAALFGLYKWLPDVSINPGAPFKTSDLAALERLLTRFADTLMIVRDDREPHSCRLFVDKGNGTWSTDIGLLGELLVRTTREWLIDYIGSGEFQYDTDSTRRRSEVIRWEADLQKSARRRAVLDPENVAVMRRHFERVNAWPDGLTIAQERELDRPGRYIGVAQGVLDLDEKCIMRPEEARKRFITLSTSVPYLPDADHTDITAILEHLPDDNRRWILEGAGYAMRGLPSRRFYMLIGPSGGGKSTLLSAISRALGDYAGVVPKDALLAKKGGGPSPGLLFTKSKRFAYASDIKQGYLDREAIANIAGGDEMEGRDLFERYKGQWNSVSTMFLSANEGEEPKFRPDDEAITARMRTLPYPERPESHQDKMLRDRVITDTAAHAAMLKLLVEHCNVNLPEDTPSVETAKEEWRRRAIGEDVYDWAKDHLTITQDKSNAIWAATIYEHAQQGTGSDAPFGLEQRTFTNLIKAVFNLPAVERISKNGKRRNGWYGVRLATAEEADIELLTDEEMARIATAQGISEGLKRNYIGSSGTETVLFELTNKHGKVHQNVIPARAFTGILQICRSCERKGNALIDISCNGECIPSCEFWDGDSTHHQRPTTAPARQMIGGVG